MTRRWSARVHITQRGKRVGDPSTGGRIEVNRITGRLLNRTVTVDVWPGDGYQRRCQRAIAFIAWRLA